MKDLKKLMNMHYIRSEELIKYCLTGYIVSVIFFMAKDVSIKSAYNSSIFMGTFFIMTLCSGLALNNHSMKFVTGLPIEKFKLFPLSSLIYYLISTSVFISFHIIVAIIARKNIDIAFILINLCISIFICSIDLNIGKLSSKTTNFERFCQIIVSGIFIAPLLHIGDTLYLIYNYISLIGIFVTLSYILAYFRWISKVNTNHKISKSLKHKKYKKHSKYISILTLSWYSKMKPNYSTSRSSIACLSNILLYVIIYFYLPSLFNTMLILSPLLFCYVLSYHEIKHTASLFPINIKHFILKDRLLKLVVYLLGTVLVISISKKLGIDDKMLETYLILSCISFLIVQIFNPFYKIYSFLSMFLCSFLAASNRHIMYFGINNKLAIFIITSLTIGCLATLYPYLNLKKFKDKLI